MRLASRPYVRGYTTTTAPQPDCGGRLGVVPSHFLAAGARDAREQAGERSYPLKSRARTVLRPSFRALSIACWQSLRIESESTPSTDEEVFMSPFALMKALTFEATTSTSLSDIATETPFCCDVRRPPRSSLSSDDIGFAGHRDTSPKTVLTRSRPDETHL